MPNFAYPSSPSPSRSPRMPQEQKWTVSPEFGDALMTAMRERTKSGGPIPRLPSLLQLSAPDNIHLKPGPSSEISPDNTKLTMKTRVAVRDKTPHRFQVVPLREIGSLVLPAQDTTPLSRARGDALSTAKLHIYGGNKTRVCLMLCHQQILTILTLRCLVRMKFSPRPSDVKECEHTLKGTAIYLHRKTLRLIFRFQVPQSCQTCLKNSLPRLPLHLEHHSDQTTKILTWFNIAL